MMGERCIVRNGELIWENEVGERYNIKENFK
jgi:hypothetical protein